jgi:AcrR family transcriptional regulator
MPRLKGPQRRQQLMEVATRLFARMGYEATTTAAIARAARITEPILYRHFKSKSELFVAIVKAVSEQTMRHWLELIKDVQNPAAQIRRISTEMPDHMAHLADAYHVLHGALATSRDKKVIAVMKEHYAQIERFFAQLVRDGQKSGIFRKDLSPRNAAWQLTMTGIGYGMIALNLQALDRALINDAIEAIIRGWRA